MAQEFASAKPEGFKNHIENVAIVGVGGRVGKYIVEELIKTGKHKVSAITRAYSTSKVPAGIEVKKVDFDKQDSLVETLKGQEVLIISMAVTAPPDQQTKLIGAAAAAGVPWVLPNQWGPDGENEQLGRDIMLGEKQSNYRARIEELGKSSWIGIAFTFIDDGTTRINTSTWPQCGRGVASLLGLKILPDDENDRSPHLSQFRNRFVYISSFLVSQQDMLDSVMRTTGTSLRDWKITHEPHKERYEAGLAELKKGNRLGFARLLYTRVFYPDGSGDYQTSKGLHNDVLGLPKEDIDQYTKVALQMAEEQGELGNR